MEQQRLFEVKFVDKTIVKVDVDEIKEGYISDDELLSIIESQIGHKPERISMIRDISTNTFVEVPME